mmetsp:Transcript_69406/g.194636  ORF Transcript_69406/g.194636 Transcript_69406/m.194636 type:complete len:208 (+) Transcript_69406:86-709(+)
MSPVRSLKSTEATEEVLDAARADEGSDEEIAELAGQPSATSSRRRRRHRRRASAACERSPASVSTEASEVGAESAEARVVVTWRDLGSDFFGDPFGGEAAQQGTASIPEPQLAELTRVPASSAASSPCLAPTSPLVWPAFARHGWCPPIAAPIGAVSVCAAPLSTVPTAAPAWGAGQSPTTPGGGSEMMAAQMAEVMRHMRQEIYED